MRRLLFVLAAALLLSSTGCMKRYEGKFICPVYSLDGATTGYAFDADSGERIEVDPSLIIDPLLGDSTSDQEACEHLNGRQATIEGWYEKFVSLTGESRRVLVLYGYYSDSAE